jgi:hypothetical protein
MVLLPGPRAAIWEGQAAAVTGLCCDQGKTRRRGTANERGPSRRLPRSQFSP